MFEDRITIDRLLARAVIGLNEWERRATQDVLISATLFLDLASMGQSDNVADGLDYGIISRQVLAHVEASERNTVEALATDVAGICLASPLVRRARVRVSKPAADRFAKSVSVVIERTTSQLEQIAYVALGSNWNAEKNLAAGAARVRALGSAMASSMVYQTAPIGVHEPDFLNAAMAIRTCLPAAELRRRLKGIEDLYGRKTSPKGQVPIDLDLCLLGNQVIDAKDIQIPHREILNRHYLALVLSETDPLLRHPRTQELLHDIAKRLPAEPRPRPRPDVRIGYIPPTPGKSSD